VLIKPTVMVVDQEGLQPSARIGPAPLPAWPVEMQTPPVGGVLL
jgi:hypothetical protein